MSLILVEILGFLELRCARWTENPEVNVRLISVPHYHISENVNPPNRIQQYSLNGDLLSEFDSVQKAAEWLYVNKKVKTLVSGVRGQLLEVK